MNNNQSNINNLQHNQQFSNPNQFNQNQPQKPKKKWYARWYMIVLYVIVGLCIVVNIGGKKDNSDSSTTSNNSSTQNKSNDAVKEESKDTKKEESKSVSKEETKKEDNVPTEYKSALAKAKIYSDEMNMSKQGIYEQLTSEYGEKFPAEAAQYAINNLQADYKQNALKKAETYFKDMNMSKQAVYDQLTSSAGEKFTAEEAQYAINNLK